MKKNIVKSLFLFVLFGGFLVFDFIFDFMVLAAQSPAVLQVKQEEDSITAYVRGGSGDSVTASLGKTECQDVTVQKLSESSGTLRTLVLIDNSVSIPKAERVKFHEYLLDLVAARKEKEVFAFGVIRESVSILSDFDNDYIRIKQALENLSYENQNTYLADALYDYLLEQPFSGEKDTFERILILSDGGDNKSIGYTKDELLGLLKKVPIPIYTIGVFNERKSNQEQLENMFAISRAAHADGILLSEMEGTEDLSNLLSADREIGVVRFIIPKEIQDGSIQTLTLTFGSGERNETVSFDGIRMPLLETEVATEVETTETEIEIETTSLESETAAETIRQKEDTFSILYPILTGIVITILSASLSIIIALFKKKKKTTKEERNTGVLQPDAESDETTLLNNGKNDAASGNTMRLWSETTRRIMLTDINSPIRSFEKPIRDSLTIGRSIEEDICISYDNSVSHKQCKICLEGGHFYIENLSKSNITEVDGEAVNRRKELPAGSVIKMGRVEMRFDVE